jgi:hypothetical protein
VYELIAYRRLGEVLAADDRGRNANAEGAGGQCRLVVGLVRENGLLVTWRWWLDGMPAVVVFDRAAPARPCRRGSVGHCSDN